MAHRELLDGKTIALHEHGAVCRESGPAAVGSMGREDGTVHGNPLLRENLESPFLRRAEGESGRPEGIHRLPGDVLEPPDGIPDIGPELFGRLLPDQLVVLRVGAHGVFFRNPPHEVRVGLGNPPDHEESGAGTRILQNPKQPLGVLVDPHLELPPLRFRAGGVIVQQVEPFLQIDGQDPKRSVRLWRHTVQCTCSPTTALCPNDRFPDSPGHTWSPGRNPSHASRWPGRSWSQSPESVRRI